MCLYALSYLSLKYSKSIVGVISLTLHSLKFDTERDDLPEVVNCVGGRAGLELVNFS